MSGIANNLLPFWLTRYPDHPLADVDIAVAAKLVRDYGEQGDELALHIFEQQAMAIGRMFTIAANFTDPDAYFVGGGVTDAGAEFRTWFVERRPGGDEPARRTGEGRRVRHRSRSRHGGRPWFRTGRPAGDPPVGASRLYDGASSHLDGRHHPGVVGRPERRCGIWRSAPVSTCASIPWAAPWVSTRSMRWVSCETGLMSRSSWQHV